MLAFLLFCSSIGFSQFPTRSYLVESPPQIQFSQLRALDTDQAHHIAISYLSDDSELRQQSSQRSLTGIHFRYKQYFKGIEVYQGFINLHTDVSGNITLILNHLEDLSDCSTSSNFIDVDKNKNMNWVKLNNQWILATWKLSDPILGNWSLVYRNDIIANRSTKLFNTLPDSTAHAQVFMVNPLNSAKKSYGGLYVDDADKDIPQLNDERKWVTIKALYDNNKFWLNADRYGFGDVSDPVTPKTFSLNDTFSFTRNQDQFEDVNAYYHITTYSDYVESLGYETLLPDSLLIDAHAYNGADLSSFNYEVNPLELEFGEGGVDDAEDGEVILHEFGHSLSFMGSPNSVDGSERKAMEEGTCDYFSTSYSRKYSDFEWEKIFNWDGHNPFWSGINTGVVKKYPDDLTQSTNADRELWSSPLMCIYDKLGQATTDTLVLEHLFYQSKNTTMPQMALVLLSIDSMLWNKEHYYEIKDCFVKFSILEWGGVGVEPLDNKEIRVFNTEGFSMGSGSLVIQSSETENIHTSIYNFSGQLVFENTGQGKVDVNPTEFTAGIYILNIQQKDVNLSLKIIKN
jgi:zinc metalloprotease ZmpB